MSRIYIHPPLPRGMLATRSYYRKLRIKADRFKADLPRKKWCDLWHTHVDWDGIGNKSWVDRRKHVNALLRMLCRARLELAQASLPCQLFVTIYPHSSADDAIYLHTANPNGTPFPHEYTGSTDVTSLPPLLAGRVNFHHYQVHKQYFRNKPIYIVTLST